MNEEKNVYVGTEDTEKLLRSAPVLPLLPRERSVRVPMKMVLIVILLLLIAAAMYFFRSAFVVATVNGSPITRAALVRGLEKSFAKQTLESLIAEKLIQKGLDDADVVATNEEIEANIKKIEERVVAQGTTIADALKAEQATMEEFRDQVTLQTRIENKFEEQIIVSDEEVTKYIKDNKVAVPKEEAEAAKLKEAIKEQLRIEKLSAEMQKWMEELRGGATIKYLRMY